MTPQTHHPLGDALGYWLRRASSALMADLGRRLGDVELSIVEATVVVLIGANENISQSTLGRELGIKSANMAPMIARLTARGLVARGRTEGRSQGLVLTTAGKRTAKQAFEIVQQFETEIAADVPEPLLEQMQAKLKQIAQRRSD